MILELQIMVMHIVQWLVYLINIVHVLILLFICIIIKKNNTYKVVHIILRNQELYCTKLIVDHLFSFLFLLIMYHTSSWSYRIELIPKSKMFAVGSFINKKNNVNKLFFRVDHLFSLLFFIDNVPHHLLIISVRPHAPI